MARPILRRGRVAFAIAAVAFVGGLGEAEATPIFVVNPAPTSAGLTFVTSVFDFTLPLAPVTGDETAILGLPDAGQGFNPNTPQFVDFGGTLPWAVTIGFGSTFTDGTGIDIRIFTAQIDREEAFDLYASADGASFALLGSYPGPAAQVTQSGPLALDIDLGGPVPSGARYLRFIGTAQGFARGFDFDAVGVVASATAVPEPASLTLLIAGGAFLACARRRRK